MESDITPRDLLGELRDPSLESVARRVLDGRRLSAEDGLALFRTSDLLTLGRLATVARLRRSGRTTWYIVNQHINYSNVCRNHCKFCAFRRAAESSESYTMSLDQVMAEAEKVSSSGATEIHIVGGLHPDLPLDYYTEMLARLSARFPQVHLQAFTAVEIAHLADRAGLTTQDTLRTLQAAGLGSLPGGGAEVFAERVRRATCPDKISGARWLSIMREAHELGIPSNATMLYGHVETVEERVAHMLELRAVQDETGGFMTFIPLAFHPGNTELAASGAVAATRGTTACDDLKTLAVSRLMLDNVPHVKAFWIMLGLHLAQLSQHWGVDDIDGTVVRERITHAAGASTPQAQTGEEIRRLITEAGFEPQERNTVYHRVIRQGHAWHLAAE